MSGPLSSLSKSFLNDKSSRLSERMQYGNTKKSSKSNKSISSGKIITPDESQHAADNTEWAPPMSWMMNDLEEDVFLSPENIQFRMKRAEQTLKTLASSLERLVKKPSDFVYDIKLFRFLSSSKQSKLNDAYKTFQDLLMKYDFAEITKGIWEGCIKVSNPSDWKIVPQEALELFYNSMMAIWFISQQAHYTQKLTESLCDFLMSIISSGAFDVPVKEQKRVQDSLKAILGLLYQFTKRIPKSHDILLYYNGIEVLNRFVQVSNKFSYNVKARATLVLAYLLTEEQQKEFDSSATAIEFLLKILRHCLESKKSHAEQFNYSLLEVLEGLNRLAVADVNKETLFNLKALDLYLLLLQHDSESEVVEAINGIWLLAFNKDVMKAIEENEELMGWLKKLAHSNSGSIKQAASGCLWTIEDLQKKAKVLSTDINVIGHVMLSYNWEVQPTVIRVKEQLVADGYRVWIDIENMYGSTLSAMSQAIENASTVIIFLTEDYKNSPACRAEAEYAYKLSKRMILLRVEPDYQPDGWLGLICGLKEIQEFSAPVHENPAFEQMRAVMADCGKGDYTSVIDTIDSSGDKKNPKANKQACSTAIATNKSGSTALENWDSNDMANWITKNKLDFLFESYGEMSHQELLELKTLQNTCPKLFFEFLKKDMFLSAAQVLRLSASLRSL